METESDWFWIGYFKVVLVYTEIEPPKPGSLTVSTNLTRLVNQTRVFPLWNGKAMSTKKLILLADSIKQICSWSRSIIALQRWHQAKSEELSDSSEDRYEETSRLTNKEYNLSPPIARSINMKQQGEKRLKTLCFRYRFMLLFITLWSPWKKASL